MIEQNEDVYELWRAVSTQWRTSGFGPVGLDYNVLFKIARLLFIPMTRPLLMKIKVLEGLTLKKGIEDREKERPKALTNG